MTDAEEEARRKRAAGRRSWPITRHSLGEEPGDDLSATTTVEERLAMMWPLALDAWAAAGIPIPDYPREQAPGRVIRPAADQPGPVSAS